MTKEFSIFFIGTGSGKTSLNRFHSSFIIFSPSFNLLVDCGDGTSKAILHNKISFDSIDGILFSHLHPDHSTGFPSFVVQLKMQERTKPLRIFCHKNLTDVLKMSLKHSFVFTERASFRVEYVEFEHDAEVLLNNNFKFISSQNSHLNKYLECFDAQKIGFASSSFLFQLERKKVFYSGDISSAKDLYIFDDKFDLAIIEANHVEWLDLEKFIEKQKPQDVYLTHLDDELEVLINQKLIELPKNIKAKTSIAYDGLTIHL